MAIDTYDNLQATVADTVNRDDLSADVTSFSPAQIDGAIKRAIAYAEKTIQRDLVARGGVKHMEAVKTTLATSPGVETLALPEDFLGVRVLAITGDPLCVLEIEALRRRTRHAKPGDDGPVRPILCDTLNELRRLQAESGPACGDRDARGVP